MLLRDLQNLLGTLNGVDVDLDVQDFLVTDMNLLSLLENPDYARVCAEKLLIQECDDELCVTLYLEAELLARLADSDPRDYLGHANLSDFCKVLEGISHFIYLAWNAGHDKSVTLMEMEMQAEVDKYIVARALLQNQTTGSLGRTLYDRLFGEPRFAPDLGEDEYVRYRDASALAGQYCRTLERRFPSESLAYEMMQDLRTFYRLPQPDKLSHINTKSFA